MQLLGQILCNIRILCNYFAKSGFCANPYFLKIFLKWGKIFLLFIHCINTVKMSEKIDVYTEGYTKFVVKELVGIKGKSESDVANFIIKDWIGDHLDELEKYDIDIERAIEEGLIQRRCRK